MRAFDNYLLKLLSSHDVTFFTPPYQRNYEWDKEQCEMFLKDVIKTTELNLAGKHTEHFFGALTYFQTKSTAFGQPTKLVLIDGQQRVTTTMLFLIALRDSIDDQTQKESIEANYLTNKRVQDDSEYKIKLKQVESDWATYCDIILGLEVDEDKRLSAIYRNYTYFCNELTKLKVHAEYDIANLIEFGIDKFSVVTVELEPDRNSWENPQEIFESMNSLGKPLSLADLVRNYLLLGKAPSKQNTLYKKYWMQLENQLPSQTSSFIRDFMQLKARKSFKQATDKNFKELYGNFKDLFKGQDTEELLHELSEYSCLYASIVLGTKTGSKEIDKRLADIRVIGATTAYSFFMALLNEWKIHKIDEVGVTDILDGFIIYIIRRRLISLTQAENKALPALINKLEVLEKAANQKTATFEILAKQENRLRLPNDLEMQRVMETMNFYNFRLANFILSLVEEKITKARPDRTDPNLTLEHIMPQTLDGNGDWEKELGPDYKEVHEQYINNIGNVTLIHKNSELSNKPFAAKKVIYENEAGLQIAKTNIIDRTVWDKDSIMNRAGWIINYILENVVPIPDSMRKTNNYLIKYTRHLSFEELGLIGQTINYISDPAIVATVVGDKEVEFDGRRTRLSPLTREIETQKGRLTASGSYQGAQYWEYDGIKLADLM